MNGTFIIAKKELRLAMRSITTYIIFVIFLVISGVFFSTSVFKIAKAELRATFGIINMIFLFYIPALTMGTISKERSNGTLELLSTMPIRLNNIVWGKFWAVIAQLAIALFFTTVYVGVIVMFGVGTDFTALWTGYLGLMFVGATYTAIGLFASSMQTNQVLSFILAFVICAFFYVIQYAMPFLPAILVAPFQFIGFDFHLQNFLRGVIDTRDLIYFGSLIYGFLLLAEFNLRSQNTMQER
ncbi:MAG: ABC transporter permease [Candidatus Cloacimonetes bacterium HGW-Cloacimonetes-1]|jgi:ABC-2 type transport system permease protein|nr:MAG: ABC transporter permease [Candidatus Cloacimonetes bacterium HGW-Cloacimonetes-1]